MNNKNCCPRGKHLYRVVSLGHCCFNSFLWQKGFVSVALRLVTTTSQAGRPLLQMAAAGDEPSRQACSASTGRERDRTVEGGGGEGEGEHGRQREAPAAAEPGTDLVCRSCNRVCLYRIGLYSQSRCGNLTRDWNNGADFMVPRLTDANNNIFLRHWWVHRGRDISRSLTTRIVRHTRQVSIWGISSEDNPDEHKVNDNSGPLGYFIVNFSRGSLSEWILENASVKSATASRISLFPFSPSLANLTSILTERINCRGALHNDVVIVRFPAGKVFSGR